MTLLLSNRFKLKAKRGDASQWKENECLNVSKLFSSEAVLHQRRSEDFAESPFFHFISLFDQRSFAAMTSLLYSHVGVHTEPGGEVASVSFQSACCCDGQETPRQRRPEGPLTLRTQSLTIFIKRLLSSWISSSPQFADIIADVLDDVLVV